MPTTMQAARIQPKRKRAQVTYYESDSSESDAEVSYALSVVNSSSAKVRRVLIAIDCRSCPSNHFLLENQSQEW